MPVPASRTTHGAGSLGTSPEVGGPRAAPGSDESSASGSTEVARSVLSGSGPPVSGGSSPSSLGDGLLSLPIGAIAVVTASAEVSDGSEGSDGVVASSALTDGAVASAEIPSSATESPDVTTAPDADVLSTRREASVVTALDNVELAASSSSADSGGGGGGAVTT